MTVTHVNPSTMHANPGFSQGTIVEGGRLLFVGEQNGVDEHGAIVAGGTREQTVQALNQVKLVLADVGATQADVAKMTIYLAERADLAEAFAASGEAWGRYPTAITVIRVAALGRPDALVGIEVVASV